MDIFWNVIGYAGSLMILLAFIMVTRAKWRPQATVYLVVSFFGAIFLAAYQIWLGAYAGVLLNVVFAGVAVWGIIAKPKVVTKKPKK